MNPVDRYSVELFPDEKGTAYVAVIPAFPGVSAFGATPAKALAEVRIALGLAIETYSDQAWPLPAARADGADELPSGEFRVRIPRSMHAQLQQRAVAQGVSQNQLVVAYLAAGLAGADLSAGLGERLDRIEEGMRQLVGPPVG